jgi:hypothetical protein
LDKSADFLGILYAEKQTPPFPHWLWRRANPQNFEVDGLWQLVVVVTGFQYWLGILSSQALASNRRFVSPTSSIPAVMLMLQINQLVGLWVKDFVKQVGPAPRSVALPKNRCGQIGRARLSPSRSAVEPELGETTWLAQFVRCVTRKRLEPQLVQDLPGAF